MPPTSDTTLRYLAMLQLIPPHPGKVSVSELRRKLEQQDHSVTARTIQRDLEKLSADFPISNEPEGRTNHWYFTNKTALLEIPSMSDATALTLRLAEDYLSTIMPPSTLQLLDPYFRRARGILGETKLGSWPGKVKIIQRGPALIRPKVKRDVQTAVYQALLENRRIRAQYRPRNHDKPKEYVINPLGLVAKDGILYLVASAWDYEDILQFALHRMAEAEVQEERARRPSGFDLDAYVHEQKEFSYPVSGKRIRLKAIFDRDAAFHLRESPLSADQKIVDLDDDTVRLTATVDDSDELRWWLRGFGPLVTVQSPVVLAREFADQVRRMRQNYGRHGS